MLTARRQKSASACRGVRGRAKSVGVGDRALLRVEESGEDGDAIRHSARVIKTD